MLAFLNFYYPKTHLIKALYSLDSSRSYGRLLENPKPGASRELFLPESDFKTSFVVNFSKKHPAFGGLETNQGYETKTRILFHMPFYIWTQYNIEIALSTWKEHLQNAISFEDKIFKKSAEKAKKLNFTIFSVLYF